MVRKSSNGSRRLGQVARLMDGVMTRGRARVRVPQALAEHRLTSGQVREIGDKVKLTHIAGKGLGLVARRAMPAHTRVGVYGGALYSEAGHAKMVRAGLTTGKYSVDFYRRGRDGRVRDAYILDPGAGAGNEMHPRHGNVLAAFVNEPGAQQPPNCVWVRNYGAGTLELWTTRAVAAGEELTVCYGEGYPRKYKTYCTRRPGVMHFVDRGGRVPRPLP